MQRDRGSRKPLVTLAVSFALTILSFLLARGVSEFQARGIRLAAEQIDATLPGLEPLSTVRTELGRADALLDTLEGAPPGDAEVATLTAELTSVRDRRVKAWGRYRALPVLPDEFAAVIAAERHFEELDASVGRALASTRGGARQETLVELHDRTIPLLARADEQISALTSIDQRLVREATARITSFRESSRAWGVALDLLSVVFSAASAFTVARLFRRFAELTAVRIGELEHFAGRVAHDLRGPLGAASLAVEVARRTCEKPEASAILERATRTLQRAGQLVDGLLVFALADKPPTEQRTASVDEVLAGIAEDVRPTAAEKGIAVTLDKPPVPLTVGCSPGVLVSLVTNLVGNAIKYMGDAPVRRVELRARPARGAVRVEVVDTGPGVPAAIRSSVFDPHVRGTSTLVPGLGLGLATVRRLAEAHGGHVGLESSDGAGSVFWFELPSAPVISSRG